jgi:hypothetical protein
MYGIERMPAYRVSKAKYCVPSSTDLQIDQLCQQIRTLCRGPLRPGDEAAIRNLAMELRAAIEEHVRMARSSLGTKQSAITARDPEAA